MGLLETRVCDLCNGKKIEIYSGSKGDHNWKKHVSGEEHKSKERKAKLKSSNSGIMKFFAKQASKPTATPTSLAPNSSSHHPPLPLPLPLPPSGSIDLTLEPTPQPNRPPPILDAPPIFPLSSPPRTPSLPHCTGSEPPNPNTPSLFESLPVDPEAVDLIKSLRLLVNALPDSIKLAEISGPLAWMSYGIYLNEVSPKDAWEELDPQLNRQFGIDCSPEAMDASMERGEYGVDGLLQWFDAAVSQYGIAAGLLRGKVERIMDSLRRCGAHVAEIPLSSQLDSPAAPQVQADPTPSPHPTPSFPASVSHTFGSLSHPIDIDTLDETAPFFTPPSRTTFSSTISQPSTKSRTTASTSTRRRPCLGFPFWKVDRGTAVGLAHYPWALHDENVLSWDPELRRGRKIYLRSFECTENVASTATEACPKCAAIPNTTSFRNLLTRIIDGCHESTKLVFHTPAQLIEGNRRRKRENDSLRLSSLNAGRDLLFRARELDAFKRVVGVIAGGKVNRVHAILTVAHRNGAGINTIFNQLVLATNHGYSVKSFDEVEFHKAELGLHLGGARLAEIIHNAYGGPAVRTIRKRNKFIQLVPSPSYPTPSEITTNVKRSFPRPLEHVGTGGLVGAILMIDEVAINRCVRWYPSTNKFLGVCREHGHKNVSLEFASIKDAEALKTALEGGQCHLACEATVMALGPLTENPQDYASHPVVISGSCKREHVDDQERLIRTTITVLQSPETVATTNIRLYSIATDGDPKRRVALAKLTLTRDLSDPLYEYLGELRLFNKRCGPDDIVTDYDYKHEWKRAVGTLIRPKGIVVLGSEINVQVLEHHLTHQSNIDPDNPDYKPLSSYTASQLLRPNDRQDVLLALRLIRAIIQLPPAQPTQSPTFKATRQAIRLYGKLLLNLVAPYTDTLMSLSNQLIHVSTAGHLLLAMYANTKGALMPSQLYFDNVTTHKAIYFTVSKMKIDNPSGKFFIGHSGSDRLEDSFGVMRTTIPGNSNADQLQLANRMSGATRINQILAEHPDWSRGSRRLSVQPISVASDNMSSKYDHLNPKSWQGDLCVASVSPMTCWNDGRVAAEEILAAFGHPVPFERMVAEGGYDMLCPFGGGKIVAVNGLVDGEDEDEDLDGIANNSPPPESEDLDDTTNTAGDYEPDFDDLVASEFPDPDDGGPITPEELKARAYVQVPGASDHKHKASVCKFISDPMTSKISFDRLSRVRGYTSLLQSTRATIPRSLELGGGMGLGVLGATLDDPAATLIRCDNMVFLAIVRIAGIRVEGVPEPNISSDRLKGPGVVVRFQILKLEGCSPLADSDDQSDWVWTGSYEHPGRSAYEVAGRYVQLLDPKMVTAAESTNLVTFRFCSPELQATALLLHEAAAADVYDLASCPKTESFPYRSKGLACFVCEDETGNRTVKQQRRCPRPGCENCQFHSGPALLTHMAAHILYDPNLKNAFDPCGFCGTSSGEGCRIRLKKARGTKGSWSVDMEYSRCINKNQYPIQMASASKYNSTNPSTNVPILCPRCLPEKIFIWKYNLKAHMKHAHKEYPLDEFAELWETSLEEQAAMKNVLTKARSTRQPAQKEVHIQCSDAHSIRFVMRTTDMDSSPIGGTMDDRPTEEISSGDPSPIVLEASGLANNATGPVFPIQSQPANADLPSIPAPITFARLDDEGGVLQPTEFERLMTLDMSVYAAAEEELPDTILPAASNTEPLAGPSNVKNTPRPADPSTSNTTSSTPPSSPSSSRLSRMSPDSPEAVIPCKRPAQQSAVEVAASLAVTRTRRKRPKRDIEVTWCFCATVEENLESWDELDSVLSGKVDVIRCNGAGCETRWFHRACVGVGAVDAFETWKCGACTKKKKRS